jgi:hypothetical protein
VAGHHAYVADHKGNEVATAESRRA